MGSHLRDLIRRVHVVDVSAHIFRKASERLLNFFDLRTRDWVPLLPLILLMVWLGSYTQSFLPPISTATSHLLDETSMSNEYRVNLVVPSPTQAAEVSRAR